MGIALDFRENIQFLSVEGNLSKADEAALRLKLDQKYSQGRTLFIFKLDLFAFDDSESMAALLNLMSYLISIGAWLGLAGLNDKNLKILQVNFKARCKGFSTEPEAKKWILEESQKPKEVDQKQKNEDEIKRAEINSLIHTYSAHFDERDPDPYRITKLGPEYLTHPTVDILHAVRSLLAEKEKLELDVQKKEAELDQTSKILMEYMAVRRLPATESELQSHSKLSGAKSSETDKSLAEILTAITKHELRLVDLKKQSEEYHAEWVTKLRMIENESKDLKNKHEKAITEMNKREQEEIAVLQKLKESAPK